MRLDPKVPLKIRPHEPIILQLGGNGKCVCLKVPLELRPTWAYITSVRRLWCVCVCVCVSARARVCVCSREQYPAIVLLCF